MHIKSLRIKNFKSHVDSEIVFDQITSITGKNDCGKTNLLRALKMLLHHTDWPVSWIKYGEDSASVKLTLTNGTVVERKRTQKSQSVTVTKPGGVVTVFEGKKDAASFIEKAVGIFKVTLDEATGPEDLNFVDVHDGPYLIGGRSDTVQRKIAGIVGANTIDDARTRLTKKARKLETKSEELALEIEGLQPSIIRDTVLVEGISNLFKDVENLNSEWDNNEQRLQEFQDINDHIIILTSYITTNNVVYEMSELIDSINQLKENLDEVTRSLDNAIQFKKRLPAIKDIKKLDELNKAVLETDKELSILQDKISEADQFLTLINQLTESSTKLDDQARSADSVFRSLAKDKEDLLLSTGSCPVCGQKI